MTCHVRIYSGLTVNHQAQPGKPNSSVIMKHTEKTE